MHFESEVTNMHRVLQYIGSLNRGGAQSAILNLYHEIDRREWQFDFVDHDFHSGELDEEIKSMGGCIYHLPSLEDAGPYHFVSNWKSFLSLHDEWNVIHSHMRTTASLMLPVAKNAGLATIVHSHSTRNDGGIKAAFKDVLQYPIRFESDFFVACSSEAGRWLFGERAFNSDQYLYLPNAIDVDKYAFNEGKRSSLRSQLGLVGKLVLGHVGRLHESKNHEFLIDVFGEFKKRCPNSVLLLVGGGPLRQQIENLIASKGLTDSVLLLGNRSDVPELLQVMDVFVFPSKWEGLPVSVVEALASGLPCYISDTLTHDVDICEAVIRLPIDDPKLWADSISLSGRVDAKHYIEASGFDIHNSARKLLELYRKADSLANERKRR